MKINVLKLKTIGNIMWIMEQFVEGMILQKISF